MWDLPDVPDLHGQALVVLEDVNGFVVGDIGEAPPVDLEDLVTGLTKEGEIYEFIPMENMKRWFG